MRFAKCLRQMGKNSVYCFHNYIYFHFVLIEFVGAVFHQQKPSNNLKTPQIRKRQRQTAYARKSFRDLVVSLVMASSVVAIGYAEFDVQSFYLQDNVRNYLVSNGYGQFGFSAVSCIKSILILRIYLLVMICW